MRVARLWMAAMEQLDRITDWLELHSHSMRIGFYTGIVGAWLSALLLHSCGVRW